MAAQIDRMVILYYTRKINKNREFGENRGIKCKRCKKNHRNRSEKLKATAINSLLSLVLNVTKERTLWMHPHTDAWFLLADKFYTKTFDFVHVVNVIENDVKLFPEDYHARERWWKFIGPVILGDPAYPLLHWLLKPCSENPNTILEHRRFNYRLSKAIGLQ
jgi:hypothetical protein